MTATPTVDEQLVSANYSPYEHAVCLRKLEGYDSNREPVWGERFAIYHPLTSEFTALSNDAWEVFDEYSASPTPIEDDTSVAALLARKHILLPSDQITNFPFVTDVTNRAEIYIETTEACNFSCAGCAVGVDRYDGKIARTMSEADIELLLRNAVRSAVNKGFQCLNVKWAGGEPTMPCPYKLVQFGQEVIADLRKQFPDFRIMQAILSNGSYVTDEFISDVSELDDLIVSVSLWGLGDQQDSIRRIGNQRFSFANIVDGVRRLHEADVNYIVHHVLNVENAPSFGDFLRATWDVDHESFLGQDWNWQDGPQPINTSLNFFRPQTQEQLRELHNGGYAAIVNGFRGGLEVARELIERNKEVPRLDSFDYLQMSAVIPTTCGSGFDYLAAGPRGVTSCHEDLFDMEPNLLQIKSGRNMLDLANEGYGRSKNLLIGANISYPEVDDTTALLLALHGGTGCPRVSQLENGGRLGNAPSAASQLYGRIVHELLSLEAMRLASVRYP